MTKIARYSHAGAVRHGVVRGDMVQPMDGTFPDLVETGEAPVPLAEVRLLAPVVPSKIIAIGPGYKAHFKGNAVPFARAHFWIKPTSTLLDPEGVIELPADVPMTCHESELAVVIGRRASNVPVESALDHVYGYTCINDVTVGNMLDPADFIASQWFVDGKIFDTFGPLGPWIETELDTTDLRIQCRVNGETRQDHRTSDRIWPLAEVIHRISTFMTLEPGDVIGTGSPPGVGPIVDGDVIEVEVEGIGVLRNSARNKAG